MSSAKLTLNGLYQWDSSIFSDMILPDGIDKDLFIASLLLKGGEFEVLYPNPVFMKNSVKIWSMKWYRTFAEWLRGTKETWNPIYNYDRFETYHGDAWKKYDHKTGADYTDSRTANLEDKRTADMTEQRTTDLKEERTPDLEEKRTADLTDTRTADLTDSHTSSATESTEFDNFDTTTQLDPSTSDHKVSAYDSSSYQPASEDTVTNGTSVLAHSGGVTHDNTGDEATTHTGMDITDHTGTEKTETTGSDITAHSGTDTLDTVGTDTMTHTGTDKTNHKGTLEDTAGSEQNTDIHDTHMYGNIGVTTSAAMLKEFYDIAQWSLYDHLCDVFVSELLIAVY